ncbi:MAG: hypothetical protein ABJG78_20630 [Cyclobacteriaceae bacterium]
MNKIISIAIFLCAAVLQAAAHNAKISTLTLRDTGAGWIIEMAFAQATIDAEMLRSHSKEELEKLPRSEYQDRIVEYVRDHFNLIVDGRNIVLQDGGIMLGSHQTNLKFVLPEIPDRPMKMEAFLPMFGASYNHTNIFRIYRGEGTMTKFFLSSENEFRTAFEFTPEGIVEVDSREQANLNTGLQTLLILGISLFALILISKRFRRNYALTRVSISKN